MLKLGFKNKKMNEVKFLVAQTLHDMRQEAKTKKEVTLLTEAQERIVGTLNSNN